MRTQRAVLLAFVAVVAVATGCDDDERHEILDLNGDLFTQKFTCNETFTGQPVTCPDLNETDQIQFVANGFNEYEVRNVPDTGFVIQGTLFGSNFVWDATSPNGYTESGTWTFSSSGTSFSGPSHYVANNGTFAGDCNTNGDVGLSSPPDPPLPPGCP